MDSAGILEFLETSSSSDEEDFIFLSGGRRKIHKITDYVSDVVNNFDEKEFKSHFRMSHEMVEVLAQMFTNSNFSPKYVAGRTNIDDKNHILIYLWFAGNKTTLRAVSQLFGVSISSVHLVVKRVISFLVAVAPQVIQFPENEIQKLTIAEEFEQISGIPGVVGCIDGSYISVRTPAHKIKSTYTNRHDMTSITLQAICDANKKFVDCFTGVPSKIHDARVFRLSFIKRKVLNMERNFHILGDAAYPLCENILTPYRDYGNLTPQQVNYNIRFSQTRVKIENAFGLLKGRFRQLQILDFFTVEKISTFILSCCVVHNLCIDNNEEFDEINDPEEADDEDDDYGYDMGNRILGETKRNEISTLLYLREQNI